MRSGDEVNGIIMRKILGDVGAEKEARSTRRETPAGYIYVSRGSSVIALRFACALASFA